MFILYGLGLIIIGAVTLKFNFQLANMVKLQWIESKIGSGSTFTVYKLFSILLVLLGIVVLSGFGDNLLNMITAPIEGIFRLN